MVFATNSMKNPKYKTVIDQRYKTRTILTSPNQFRLVCVAGGALWWSGAKQGRGDQPTKVTLSCNSHDPLRVSQTFHCPQAAPCAPVIKSLSERACLSCVFPPLGCLKAYCMFIEWKPKQSVSAQTEGLVLN